ncbi:MAG: nucleotidyltransferase family protein [Eubacteriales bacterium]|nr:nucleotidyltransferase family protein [Eubacteriales bacterium]
MDAEQTLLVRASAAALSLSGPLAEIPAQINKRRVLSLALTQRTAVMTAYALNAADPRSALANAAAKSTARSVRSDAESELISEAFSRAGIRHMFLKGTVLRPLYPRPEFRESVDLDILIDRERLAEAETLIGQLGYDRRQNGANDVDFVKPPSVSVELHFELFPTLYREGYEFFRDVLSRGVPETGSRLTMRPADCFAYMTLHTAKHFVGGGITLRALTDTAVFLRAHPGLENDPETKKALEAVGMTTFASTLCRLAGILYSDGGELSEEDDALLSFIITDDFMEKSDSVSAAQSGSRASLLLRRLFPSRAFMAVSVPFTRHSVLLLPAGYAVRWARFLVGKRQAELRPFVEHLRSLDPAAQRQVSAILQRCGLAKFSRQ